MARELLRARRHPRVDDGVFVQISPRFSRWLGCLGLLALTLAGCARPIPAQWQAVPPLPAVPFEKAWPVLVSTVTDKYPIETSDPVAGYIRSGWIVLDTCWHGLFAGGRQPCLQARSEVRVLRKDPLQLQVRVNLLKKPSPVMGVQRDWISAGNHPKMEEELRAEFVRRIEALRASNIHSPASQPAQPIARPPSQGGPPKDPSRPSLGSEDILLIKRLKASKQAGHTGHGVWTLTGMIVNPTGRAATQASLMATFLDDAGGEILRDQQVFPLSQTAQESAFAWKVNAVPQTASKVKVRILGATWAGDKAN